jgi:hypothetical protein
MNCEISESDLATLHALCGIPASEPLPEKLLGKYRAAKIVCDRAPAYPVRNEFVRICVECGFGKLTESEARPSVASLWRRMQIKSGQAVLVNWREKQVAGRMIALDAVNQATVILDGDGLERKVAVECITLQSAA